ncbi:putative cytochrome P450 1A4-like [Apostichopus japonicus]|uniref:Putative cytochrome P450 1A4-like n=1 Tax=Stichopus japonicus TaxID=307972 RepID=A0A2G8L4L3_STIJA|nr:putative cytochrome P450 1A4-like [Apostichopus japonicus]
MTLSEGIDPKQRQELKLTDERIRSVVYDFFGAGFETVASTLMWAFLYAIYFPDLQKRMQKEMDDVIGRDRLPSLADRGRLPLTEAFLAEVSRHSLLCQLHYHTAQYEIPYWKAGIIYIFLRTQLFL